MSSDIRRAALVAVLMFCSAALAVAITPRQYMSDQYPRESLAQIVPKSFSGWEVDRSIVPVPPSPDLQQVLDETYDETLAQTYRNAQGRRVMLSLAYGRNQHKGMNTHRPEVCYPAQGFKLLRGSEAGQIDILNHSIDVTRVVAATASRTEPITYWLLVGDQITKFGYSQRAVAMEYGLRGVIPDGVLVRVSSIDTDEAAAFALQDQFIRDMLGALPASKLRRLVGAR